MRAVLAISFGLNVALGLWLIVRDSPAKPISPPPTAPPQPSQIPATHSFALSSNAPGALIDWAKIESADYREYIQNLRETGCPEELVRDLVAVDVHKQFLARVRQIVPPPEKSEYWQKFQAPTFSPEQRAALKDLQKEESAIVSTLLGGSGDPQLLVDRIFGQTDHRLAELGWLPLEKRQAAQRILNEAGLRSEELSQHADELARDKELLASRMELLKGVLTDSELEEYKLRTSQLGSQLRAEFKDVQLAPDEFKFLYELRSGGLSKTEDFYAMQKKQAAALREKFGAERTAQIERGMDFTYRYVAEGAQRYGLDPAIAEFAWKTKHEAIAEASKIRQEQTLSPEARQARLAELKRNAESSLSRELGPKVWDWARKYDGAWLELLTELKVRGEE